MMKKENITFELVIHEFYKALKNFNKVCEAQIKEKSKEEYYTIGDYLNKHGKQLLSVQERRQLGSLATRKSIEQGIEVRQNSKQKLYPESFLDSLI